MGARVFISHRSDDAAATAARTLADELDGMFGDGQVVRIAANPASAERWQEALAGRLGDTPILVAMVTPAPADGDPVPPDDAALRTQLDAGVAAGILVLPLLGDGVATLAPDAELPTPFRRLSHFARQPFRQAEWFADLARLGETLRGLGVRPLPTTLPGTMPLQPVHDEGPTTTPMPLEDEKPVAASVADGRRGLLGGLAAALLLAGAGGVWLWRQRRSVDLSGPWRARIGPRGAPTSRDGTQMLVTLAQKDRNVALSSTVAIESDPQWDALRERWRKRNNSELKFLIYRGEGELMDEDGAAAMPASAAVERAAGSAPIASPSDRDRPRRGEAKGGARWVRIAVRISTPGVGSETIDTGVLRGVIDRGDQSIQGRLWLETEQAERVVDLRRGE